jgi:hypothetical protein
MKAYGLSIRKIQVAINTDSKGLNKSFFNVIERLKTVDNLPNTKLIKGAEALVGDYIRIADIAESQIPGYLDKGYVRLPVRNVNEDGTVTTEGNYLIKPTTIAGKVSIQSLLTAYKLYNNFLPYDCARFNEIFNEILPAIQNATGGETNTVELKQEILQEVKKYLGVVNGNGIIHGEDLSEYRRELYMDTKDNTSLPNYLRELMSWKTSHPVIDTFIKGNALFKKFEFDINVDGEISRIKYNNATGESFDEQELHNAFLQLLSVSHQLPKIGNKQYKTD